MTRCRMKYIYHLFSLTMVTFASACSQDEVSSYRLDLYPDLNQTMTGYAKYFVNGSEQIFDLNVNITGRAEQGNCASVTNCDHTYILNISSDVVGLTTDNSSATMYFDENDRYLFSIDSSGVRCVPTAELLEFPESAAVGTFGNLPQEDCSDGTSTTVNSWSLNAAPNGNAELVSNVSYNDGSSTTLTFLIDQSGNVLGSKLTGSGEEGGVQYYASAQNY